MVKEAPITTRRGTTGKLGNAASEAAKIKTLEDQLHAVRAIGGALASSVGLNALFEQIVPHVTRVMNADRSTLFLYHADTEEIWSKVAEGEGLEIRLKIGEGIAGHVAETRSPISIGDAYADPRFRREVDAETGFRTKTVAAAPVIDRSGHLLGVIQVLNKHGGEFNEEDMGLLETIAIQIAYAVENTRLSQNLLDQNRELEAARHRAERRRAELDLLYQLEQETTASDDLDGLLDSIILRVCDRLRSQAGSVLLLDQDTGRLFFRGVSGERKDQLKQLSLSPGQGVVGWVAERGEPLLVNRPEEDDRHSRDLAAKIDYPAEALLAVPLRWGDVVIGAVEVLNPRPRPTGAVGYDEEDLKVLTLIAAQVARAVALTRERQEKIGNDRLVYLGRMLAGVAHDLRNPMTVISGYTQIIAAEPNAEERRSRCERVLNQIDEMTAMIGDLLAFARGDTHLRPTDVDIEALGREIGENLAVQCEPRGITLEVVAEPGEVRIDLGRAKRIINNLAKNAVDVLSRNGELRIELAPKAGGLTLKVSDTGPGIPTRLRDVLFEPFVTANKDTGVGLGLSIVKRFVEDHGGRIEIESTAGKGTTFRVELPRASMAEAMGGKPS